jgi:hypothetical protein
MAVMLPGCRRVTVATLNATYRKRLGLVLSSRGLKVAGSATNLREKNTAPARRRQTKKPRPAQAEQGRVKCAAARIQPRKVNYGQFRRS